MTNLKLTNFFSGAGAKKLSAVEVDRKISHQHEFNGVAQFKEILGLERKTINSVFLYLDDEESEIKSDSGTLTWYDARENDPKRSEYRLYFSENTVINASKPNDLLVIAKKAEIDELVVIVAKNNSTMENQLIWLFGFGKGQLERFSVKSFDPSRYTSLDFASKIILKNIGMDIVTIEEEYTDFLIREYPADYPSTSEFSDLAYTLAKKDIDEIKDPDGAVLKLLNKEETLFRILEKYYVEKKLKIGFENVDDFVKFSLSIQNRRKSRAGKAFENHLEKIFEANGLEFDTDKVTENNSKPDFIFPGIKEYHDANFNPENLTMLGAKTTCKDRWRQILAEAGRIEVKHLTTLEPSISKNQTDEMKSKKVVLVLPNSLHETYDSDQRKEIISLKDFIVIVKQKQAIAFYIK